MDRWSDRVVAFLLRMTGLDTDVQLRATHHPEFDAWRWSNYWVSLDSVIEFKRGVYTQALNELSPIIFKRPEPRFPRQREVPVGDLSHQDDTGEEPGSRLERTG